MKKLFLFSAVTAGLFTSCVQNDSIVPELSEAEKEIKFQTVVEKHQTRAIITGADYGDDAPSFGSTVFWNKTSIELPGVTLNIDNEEVTHHNTEDKDYWGTAQPYYWPESGSMTFYSYSPYYFQEGNKDEKINPLRPSLGEYGFKFNNYNVAAHQSTDLMVAEIKYGQTANVNHGAPDSNITHTGVPTIFHHKLAMIGGFVLSTSEDYDGLYDGANEDLAKSGDMVFRIKKITLKNIVMVGSFTSEGISITQTGAVEPIAEKWTLSTNSEDKMEFVWFDDNSVDRNDNNINVNDGGVYFGQKLSRRLNIAAANPINAGIYHRIDPQITSTDFTKNAENVLLVIPQEFLTNDENSPYLEVVYSTNVYNGTSWDTPHVITKKMPLSEIHKNGEYKGWQMNKKIVYELEFATTEIQWAPSVVNWDGENVHVDY